MCNVFSFTQNKARSPLQWLTKPFIVYPFYSHTLLHYPQLQPPLINFNFSFSHTTIILF